MYFSGHLSIDPSQVTEIERIKPTRAFRKFLHLLTAGGVSDEQENETFTAVSVLQGFNRAFRAAGITNIVRLAKDDIDFYFDEEGRDDDLKEAMEKFELDVDAFDSEYFKSLFLVVEHEDEDFKYLIETRISRVHSVGKRPIDVSINGMLKEFKAGAHEDREAVKKKLEEAFGSQESYDSFLNEKREKFRVFVDSLEMEVKKFITTDQIVSSVRAKIVRPRKPATDVGSVPIHRGAYAEPAFYGYYGSGDYFFYAWMWGSMCHDHHIHCHDVDIVDEHGSDVLSVGEEGFDAGQGGTLDPEQEFEVPEGTDAVVHEGSDFDADIGADVGEVKTADVGDSGGSWFDSFGGDSGDAGGADAGCSSCGGGCGGD